MMTKPQALRSALMWILVFTSLGFIYAGQAYAQRAQTSQAARVCGDPTVRCRTTGTFDPNDLPFQLGKNGVIWETEKFYAIILKSVAAPDDNCDVFVSEAERLRAQALFPKSKVFTSRCQGGGTLYYSNVTPNQHFMAVYAGTTKAQANAMLARVKATGKYPGANIRRMTVGFNGT